MTAGEEEPRTSLVRRRELAEASGQEEALKKVPQRAGEPGETKEAS